MKRTMWESKIALFTGDTSKDNHLPGIVTPSGAENPLYISSSYSHFSGERGEKLFSSTFHTRLTMFITKCY